MLPEIAHLHNANLLQIQKIYVLAINHTEEKMKDIQRRLDELGLPYPVSFEVLEGHNGYTDPLPEGAAVYEDWPIEGTTNTFWKYPVNPGEIGCTLSHINAWKRVVEDGVNRALILEEDFYGIKPLRDLKSPPSDINWDFMYLGRYAFEDATDVEINDQWLYPGFSYNMQAYMLTQEGAQKLVDHHLERNIFINDEFINATFTTHRRPDIEAMYPNKNITAISVKEDWIGQTSNEETTLVSKHGYEGKSNNMNNTKLRIQDDSDWEAWKQRYITPVMLQKDFELMTEDIGPNIAEFPLFTQEFCTELIELAETKGEWTIGRHEFYPTNDMLMEDLGMKEIYTRVIREFVAPLATWYFTLEGQGWDTVEDETFIIRYRPDRQGQLSVHHDYSSYTIGVKLNDEFEGGGTFFPKYQVNAMPKRNGNAFLHPGMITHRHGGRPVYSGTRYINVSFIRNTHILK